MPYARSSRSYALVRQQTSITCPDISIFVIGLFLPPVAWIFACCYKTAATHLKIMRIAMWGVILFQFIAVFLLVWFVFIPAVETAISAVVDGTVDTYAEAFADAFS